MPLPSTGALGIPGAVWTADVRRTIGVLGSLRASLDRVLPVRPVLPVVPVRPVAPGSSAAPVASGPSGRPEGTRTSLGALVRRRMGRRVLDSLVAPVVSGVHATHPDDVDADAVLPGLTSAVQDAGSLAGAVARMRAAAPAGSAVAGLRGGMHRLVEALRADLGARGVPVVLGAPVTGIAQGPASTGWSVRTAQADHRADVVVVATPGPAAADLLESWAPSARGLGEAGPRVVLATLVLDAPALDTAPRGTGVLVATGTSVRAKALTHATAKWAWLAEQAEGRHVVRLSYSPVATDDPVDWPADRLLHEARRDAAALLGVPLAPEQVRGSARTVWAQGLPRTAPGRAGQVAAVRVELARTDGLQGTGAWLAGTGLVAVVADARAVARDILQTAGRNAPDETF